jgi:hypoxanthine phosphoribosyltransferase
VVDDIADTGQTLAIVADSATALGAVQVVTAILVSHSWADPFPQVSALVSDEFVIFPWDEQVLIDGKWVTHPEIIAGLKAQTGSSQV